MEGLDGQCKLHGRQPYHASAQHREHHDGGSEWRLIEEDHGRCEGRSPGAEGYDQYDGGPAELVRLGSNARGS